MTYRDRLARCQAFMTLELYLGAQLTEQELEAMDGQAKLDKITLEESLERSVQGVERQLGQFAGRFSETKH